jgi:hypothetical protein
MTDCASLDLRHLAKINIAHLQLNELTTNHTLIKEWHILY